MDQQSTPHSVVTEPSSLPLVVVPRDRSRVVRNTILLAVFVGATQLALPLTLSLGMLAHDPKQFEKSVKPGSAPSAIWFSIYAAGGISILVAASIVNLWRSPELAVFVDGIKLPMNPVRRYDRVSPQRSRWDRMSRNFYFWNEVSYCRWGRYEPHKLAIHLNPVEQKVVVLWGAARVSRFEPIVAQYRVPEPYRASVEAAIRAAGKWVD